jgi:hypothetical protein
MFFTHEVALSFCVASFVSIDTIFTALGAGNNSEATYLESSGTSYSYTESVSVIARQLGVDGPNMTLSQRGVMSLKKQDPWLPMTDWASPGTVGKSEGVLGWNLFYTGRDSSLLCDSCTLESTYGTINLLMLAIFRHTLLTSGSLARGLQALLMVGTITRYYSR